MRPVLRRSAILAVRAFQAFSEDRCSHMAAAISYFALLSLLPLLILLVSVTGIFLRSASLQQDLVNEVLDILPLSQGEGANEVSQAVRAVAGVSIPLTIVGLAGLAWSASAMFGVIRTSINVAWGSAGRRSFVRQKLLDLAMMASFGVFFLLSIGMTGLLRATQEASSDLLGPLSGNSLFFWRAVSFTLPAVLSLVTFAALYRYVPNAPVKMAGVWVGAATATLLFELAKNGFSFYLANFGRYDVIYGSLGAAVTFLVGLYVSAAVLLYGAEVAAEYPKVVRGEHDDLWGQVWPLGGWPRPATLLTAVRRRAFRRKSSR
jgi:membrane protein